MTRKRTMNDKGRRALTRTARAARNPEMNAKRPPAAAAKSTTAATKSPEKRTVKDRVAVSAADTSSPAAQRGAKAMAKIMSMTRAKAGAQAVAKSGTKSGTKSGSNAGAKRTAKVTARAVATKTPLASSPDVAAKPLGQGGGGPFRAKPRPRVRQLASSKRGGAKRKGMGVALALARFAVGDVVRHKFYPFRGVIFDIDPVFANTDDWWLSIPEQMRPKKNQPFYHLLAENAETEYIAYVSEQNLMPDTTGVPVRHPQVADYFVEDEEGRYRPVFMTMLN